jgi:hypothetical protein
VGEDGLARAVAHAPGFVRVRELADSDSALAALTQQLLAGVAEGVFTLCAERPRCVTGSIERPGVAEHVRVRAAAAVARHAPTAVLTSALHRSFRVPWAELAVVALLDGRHTITELASEVSRATARAGASLAGPLAAASPPDAERFVSSVIDRFTRHLFLVPGAW